jgi:hypothetical protein
MRKYLQFRLLITKLVLLTFINFVTDVRSLQQDRDRLYGFKNVQVNMYELMIEYTIKGQSLPMQCIT